MSTNASINRQAFSQVSSAIVNALDVHYELGTVADDSFEITARLTITSREQGNEVNRPVVLQIECTFGALFEVPGSGFPKEYAQRFTSSEARLIVWPYFREFISSMSLRMGLPPLVMPLAFRTDSSEKADEQGASSVAPKKEPRKKK